MKKFVFGLFTLFLSMYVNAYEVKDVCIKYQVKGNADTIPHWSQGYKVQANIIDGQELSQKTRCYTCYDPLDKYVVVFWGDGQATVIDTDSPFLSLYTEGRDQQGRIWEVSDSPVCM
ncbi:hypothetical protein [Rodentibacter pneumotropicus]|uniref:Uncharacterized protein n=1 Tax=Rodentibacter pneumotropicus TaxID=758 RepID=A0A4S2Q5A9_9PAST|nr:hypothetical protein [Rodentibacter pneumotropicus]THA11354.1 hypothetical protein D3M78_00630 [Rodentibacter pneumotropicus]